MCTGWYYPDMVSWETLLFPPAFSAAGGLARLVLLHNRLRRDVSSSTAGTEGVGYLASSLGSNQVQQQKLSTIFSAPCSDMRLGNWLDLNICMLFSVPTESYDSLSSIHRRSEFWTHGCQSDPCFSKGETGSASSRLDAILCVFSSLLKTRDSFFLLSYNQNCTILLTLVTTEPWD